MMARGATNDATGMRTLLITDRGARIAPRCLEVALVRDHGRVPLKLMTAELGPFAMMHCGGVTLGHVPLLALMARAMILGTGMIVIDDPDLP